MDMHRSGHGNRSVSARAWIRGRACLSAALRVLCDLWVEALPLYPRGSGTNLPPGNGFGVPTGGTPGITPRATRFARLS